MKRGAYVNVATRNSLLLARIREIKAERPFWGYRCIWAYLRFVNSLRVGKDRAFRLMADTSCWCGPIFASGPNVRPRRKASSLQAQRVVGHRHDQGHDRRLQLGLRSRGLDWRPKKLVGRYTGKQAKA